MHAISSYRGNKATNTQRPPTRYRQDRYQYTAPLSLARSVNYTSITLNPWLKISAAAHRIAMQFVQLFHGVIAQCNMPVWKSLQLLLLTRTVCKPLALGHFTNTEHQCMVKAVSWAMITWGSDNITSVGVNDDATNSDCTLYTTNHTKYQCCYWF